jgi:hypothetical protein
MRTGSACAVRSDTRSPRFRRVPFVRDGVFDHGGAAVPRITAVPVLPSTLFTASASASSSFRGSISHPIRLLCTLRSGRRLPPRNTHYQAGATPYRGRTSTGWITPACLAHEQKTYTRRAGPICLRPCTPAGADRNRLCRGGAALRQSRTIWLLASAQRARTFIPAARVGEAMLPWFCWPWFCWKTISGSPFGRRR